MARYYFNIIDHVVYKDVDGTECPTAAHARREAARLAGYSLMTQPEKFWNGAAWTIEVTREDRSVIFRLIFRADNVLPDEWTE